MLSTTRELSPSSPRRVSKRRRRRRRRRPCCCCVQTHLFRRFFFFLFTLYIYLRGFKNSGVFDTFFKGWESIENNHFTCVSPRLPSPSSSFSPRLSRRRRRRRRSSAFCPSFFEGAASRYVAHRRGHDTGF